MDQKRELTSVDLRALVAELSAYEGAKVDKAYLYGDDFLRLRMRDFDRGRVELVVEVGDVKRAHVAAAEHVPEAPERPPDFAMMLRNRIAGADFVGVSQFEFDRILTFDFERPDTNTTIVVELFGEGNVAVLNDDREVVQSLETVRLKSRTVAPGSQYEFPSSRFNPLTADYDAFEARMNASDTDVVRTLATQLNFGGLYAEELCTRAGVEKTLAIDDAGEAEYERLYDAISRLAARLRAGDLDPRVYYEDGDDDGRRVDATPLPLEEHEAAGLSSEVFETFNEALDDYFAHFESEDEPSEAGRDRPDFEAELAKQERIIEQQENAIESFEEEAEEERRKAELLYERYDLVDDIVSTVQGAREEGRSWDEIEARFAEGREQGIPAAEAVVGVDERNGTVTLELDDLRIEVDPSVGVEKNADSLYTGAKEIEEKKAGAQEAIEDTRERLAAVKRRREEWKAGEREEEEEEPEETEERDWLAASSIPTRQSEHWYERFRWFRTSDGFLVIGGRNADQNEELVKKYLEGPDLFFHTQAHGGPVTVLKATDPGEAARDVEIPDRSKEQAAQFAVAYSSVWKDGRHGGDAYMVHPDQVSKTPESGEYLEKGGFAIRGDRTYFRDLPARVEVGIQVEPETRVVGGPPAAIDAQVVTSIELEPGRYAQNDAAKMCYREFRERFTDTSFVRKIASADRIQEFLPPGGSRLLGSSSH
ncbi:MAG: ribosome rescue protein RqcH [Haloarculaceae archaeon]